MRPRPGKYQPPPEDEVHPRLGAYGPEVEIVINFKKTVLNADRASALAAKIAAAAEQANQKYLSK